MSFDLILSNIAKHIELNHEEEAFFTDLLLKQALKKKHFLLSKGQSCHYISFVNSGLLRAYHINEDGKETTVMFAIADWWITDMNCFVNQQPAMLTIQAVNDSNILKLSKTDLDRLFEKVPKFERFFRIVMQNAYIREQLRGIQNLSANAHDRYHSFLSKYPQIASSISQKQLASFLGITPEFLSLLRKNVTKP